MLTQERLKELLHYDPETGIFTRLTTTAPNARMGDIAGCVCEGRVSLVVDLKHYRAHRLAWLYMTGRMPRLAIDHIDTDGTNNRWSNLRLATKIQNGQNRGKNRNNTSGYKGVTWHKQNQKWLARIWVRGEVIYLGLFENAEDAGQVYSEAAKKYHGDFANDGTQV